MADTNAKKAVEPMSKVDLDDAVPVVSVTPEIERRIVRKVRSFLPLWDQYSPITRKQVDWHVLPILCGFYLFQALDKGNIGLAKLGGIQADTGTTQNGIFNIAVSLFFLGYVCGEPLSNYLLLKINPRILIGVLGTGWGVSVACIAAARNPAGLFMGRIFLGFFESGILPASLLITSLWYPRKDHAFKVAIWFGFSSIGSALGGIISYLIQKNLTSGPLHPWGYLMLIEGGATVLWSILAFFICPDLPERATFLTEEERLVVLNRLRADRSQSKTAIVQSQVWDAVRDYKVWILFVIYFCFQAVNVAFSTFTGPIIAALGFTNLNAQLMSAPFGLFNLALQLGLSYLSDRINDRSLFLIGGGLFAVVGYLCVIFIHLTSSTKGVLYGLLFFTSFNPGTLTLILAWATSIIVGTTKRTTAVTIIVWASAAGGFAGSYIYQDGDVGYHIGHSCNMILIIVGILSCVALRFLLARENKRRDVATGGSGEVVLASSLGELMAEDFTDANPEFRSVKMASDGQRMNFSSMIGSSDFTTLPDASDEAIIANVRERFNQDILYTRSGPSILVAVNPNKPVENSARPSAFDLEAVCGSATAPHPKDIAASAYLHMVRASEDQAILTSGESGSGKSEILKLVLQQIVFLSEQTDEQNKIHREVLNADIILECFGNAQVLSNKNSTRYSRYTELKFNEDGTIVGQKIVDYLFEHTRVSQCPEEERNFHIFYLLLSSMSREERSKWNLSADPKQYHYLNHGKGVAPLSAEVPTMETLKGSLKTLGFTKKIQNEIFQVLAGIIHLGNIEFTEEGQKKGYGAYVKNTSALEVVSDLFGVSAEKLEECITTSTYLSGDTVCSNFLDVAQSVDARNSLASVLYQLLFRWIIEQINNRLGSSRLGADNFVNQIGLLDIAGFEDRNPKPNGFDQFVSNYANEKLQTFVLQRCINATPDSLEYDNVKLDVAMPGRVETGRIDLFEDNRAGLFAVIDKETMRAENGKEATVLAALQDLYADNSNRYYEAGPPGWMSFKIRHYTGKAVSYNVNGFIAKNRNSMYADVINLFGVTKKSTTGRQKPQSFIASLFTDSIIEAILHPNDENAMVGARPAAPAKISGTSDRQIDQTRKRSVMLLSSPTLAATAGSPSAPLADDANLSNVQRITSASTITTLSQLRNSIDDLLDALNGMRTWTILCLRPNVELIPNKLDERKMRDQIQAFKLQEIIRAAAIEYAVGIEFGDFLNRYTDAGDDDTVESRSQKSTSKRSKAGSVGAGSVHGGEDNDEKPVKDESRRKDRCLDFITQENWEHTDATCGDSRIFLKERLWRNLEARLDTKEGDEAEQRRIHIVTGKGPAKRSNHALAASAATMNKVGLTVSTSKAYGDVEKGEGEAKIQIEEPEEAEEEEPKKKSKGGCCGPREKKPKVKMSPSRKCWVGYTWFVTWWVPDCALHYIGRMKTDPVRFAWREKCALCFIVLLLSGVMLFFVQGFGKLLCPTQDYFTASEVARHTHASDKALFVSMNGHVYDIYPYAHPVVSITGAAGTDISPYFPRFDPISMQPLWPTCNFINVAQPKSDNSRRLIQYNDAANSRCTTGLPNTPSYCHDTVALTNDINTKTIPQYTKGLHKVCATLLYFAFKWIANESKKVGVLAVSPNDVKQHFAVDDGWVTINNKVYNFTALFMPGSPYSINPGMGFGVNDLGPPGGDASANSTLFTKAIDCFDNLFLVAYIDLRVSDAGCNASAYILYGVTGVMVAVLVVKFLAALQLAPRSYPEKNDRFVILQVPCYNEGEASLRKTIESLALLDYDDTRKLLFIVSDGMVKSAGSDMRTAEIVMQILGVDKSVQQPEAKSYLAIGRGLNAHNKAKVYSGLFSIQARYVPYIFISKVGKEGETSKPGNRGKRDSQMILMKFLNRVNFGSPMTPLELETYHHIKNVIGVDPFLYEYCLMVDADTRVEEQSLNRLISSMVNDANTMGICGETQIENERESWVTMMQVYEYYISHHMAKAFESLFGSVTCLPGCFCMYRLRTPKKVPLLIANQILNEYEDIKVDTLHKQNLLSLGEDRFLTTLMLKHFPEYRNKFTPDAVCFTIVPDQFAMLLGQRRRWINSTIHNLFELIFLPTLCGCLCFSMRLVVFLDLFATLIMPASTAYLGYLIYASIQAGQAPIISLIMLSAAYGLQILIFLLKQQYQHIGWLIISILAMPFFSFYIPLYAYWHFDDFKWGNTRKGASIDANDKGHGGDPELETFDQSLVPQITWEAYEAQLLKPNGEVGQSMESTVSANPYKTRSEYAESTRSSAVRHPGVTRAMSGRMPNGSDANMGHYASGDSISGGMPRKWVGGYPSDDEILRQMRFILGTSDLHDLSKKKVREALGNYFGVDLNEKKSFINENVELIIQGRV
ncbi:hypothetical protein HK101_007273 [Irineochytrium annulatum]|nr:hypothetical protein HK101_007273 [Irineochytrium annulatum]